MTHSNELEKLNEWEWENKLRNEWKKAYNPNCELTLWSNISDWWLARMFMRKEDFSARIQAFIQAMEGKKITKKKGIGEMLFGDKRKEFIRLHTNMDVGYNKAIEEMVALAKQMLLGGGLTGKEE